MPLPEYNTTIDDIRLRNILSQQQYISQELREFVITLKNRFEDFRDNQGNTEVSGTFNTISEHILDQLKEASRSSVFERHEQLKTMDYIRDIIETKVSDEKEKKELLKAYEDAASSIRQSVGLLRKSQQFLIDHIGDIMGIFTSYVSNMPPIMTFLATRGGDFISNFIKRRQIKNERGIRLGEEIDFENNNSNSKRKNRILGEPDNFQEVNSNSLESVLSPSNLLNDSGNSLIENNPVRRGFQRILQADGTKRKPYYVKILGREKEDDSSLVSKIFGMIATSVIFKKITTGVTAIATGVTSLLGIFKTGFGLFPDTPTIGASKPSPTISVTPDNTVLPNSEENNSQEKTSKKTKKKKFKPISNSNLPRRMAAERASQIANTATSSSNVIGKVASKIPKGKLIMSGIKALGKGLLGSLLSATGVGTLVGGAMLASTAYDVYSLAQDMGLSNLFSDDSDNKIKPEQQKNTMDDISKSSSSFDNSKKIKELEEKNEKTVNNIVQNSNPVNVNNVTTINNNGAGQTQPMIVVMSDPNRSIASGNYPR